MDKLTSQSLGVIRSWDFDILVVVLFDKFGNILKAVELKTDDAKQLAKENEYQNGYILTTSKELLDNSKTRDLTKELQNILGEKTINSPIFDPLKDPPPIPEITHDFNKLNRALAIELCRKNGFNLYGEITFSSKNKSSDLYWANPNIEFLSNDWWLLLNDYKNNNLHIFDIPANSIRTIQIKTRADKPEQIDLQIKYRDDAFEDSRSGIRFVKWFIKTIPY
ncbi:hypothetical protein AGMMS50229_03660 [Campylobacterota bacterium]|nr:hypothetical protein AGMMS50229_03660 [Campylobacterota bacterium]